MREECGAAGIAARDYLLLDSDAVPYRSPIAGTVGGHRRQRIYGRLDCPAALRALRRGNYAAYRVFFADEATAAPPDIVRARGVCRRRIGAGSPGVQMLRCRRRIGGRGGPMCRCTNCRAASRISENPVDR